MKLTAGQRFISQTEPELGLGIVVNVSSKQIEIQFTLADTIRSYSIDNAPIKRVEFRHGDKIKNSDGKQHEVLDLFLKDNLIHYKCSDEIIPENKISHDVVFNSPLHRLQQGILDEVNTFDIRFKALKFKSEILSNPVRGFTGGRIDLLPHQFYVAHKIVNSENKRFFLSDEVGLGKTIEACLALHRLLITQQISRILIVVPTALIHQWFIELFRRFNILSTIVNDDFKEDYEENNENLFAQNSPIIISLDELKKNKLFQSDILNTDWDLLIVDEAHHILPDTKEYKIIKEISKKIERLFLLTATPEALTNEGFFSLLNIIDPEKFSDYDHFLKEQESYEKLAKITADLIENQNIKSFKNNPEFKNSLKGLNENDPQFVKHLTDRLNDIHGIGRSIFRNSRSVIKGFPGRKVKLIEVESTKSLKGINDISSDLLNWLSVFTKENLDKKSLIICSSIDSALKINKELSKIGSTKIALFHEEMTILQLDRNAAWFSEKEGAQILIASEIGSEGRNFQFADHIILPDLPLDPELLEQRIGRLDRIGRKKDVEIIVPYEINSPKEVLALWYHKGVNAFKQIVPGAYRIGEEFNNKLHDTFKNSESIDSLIKDTKKYCKDLNKKISNGKNQLLEMASFDPTLSGKIVKIVEDMDHNIELHDFIEELFELYGITFDELSMDLFKLDLDTLSDHTFPLPVMRSETIQVTWNRSIALIREDTEFLSMDHPMIFGALDLFTSSEKGNSTFAIYKNSGEEGYMLETVYVLEPVESSKDLIRFLPSVPIRILLDDTLDDVSDLFQNEQLSFDLSNASIQNFEDDFGTIQNFVHRAINECESIASKKSELIKSQANSKIKHLYENETVRIETLISDSKEKKQLLKKLDHKFSNLKNSILSSNLRIDSLRLIKMDS